MALPTTTGTGKDGAAAGDGAACAFPAPPSAVVREPLGDGDTPPDGVAEAEGDADEEAEAEGDAEEEPLGEADEAGASGATLWEVGAASAAGAA
ncbi:hypothetical protein [Streptomyces spiramyceticus]|uniref:hypothetical protein n=1 Tax=Streptomyces spiramyceticus TaxID=299717 RepID=UPI00237B2417|nr:hypothetical protein [Streptomyces spiramyceticus]